jgi:hypothetical protein
MNVCKQCVNTKGVFWVSHTADSLFSHRQRGPEKPRHSALHDWQTTPWERGLHPPFRPGNSHG